MFQYLLLHLPWFVIDQTKVVNQDIGGENRVPDAKKRFQRSIKKATILDFGYTSIDGVASSPELCISCGILFAKIFG